MPLENAAVGTPGFSRNIAREEKAGKPPKQAVAIAYSKARGDTSVQSMQEELKKLRQANGNGMLKMSERDRLRIQELQLKIRAEQEKARGDQEDPVIAKIKRDLERARDQVKNGATLAARGFAKQNVRDLEGQLRRHEGILARGDADLSQKEWEKDVAAFKAGRKSGEKLAKKWGARGAYFLSGKAQGDTEPNIQLDSINGEYFFRTPLRKEPFGPYATVDEAYAAADAAGVVDTSSSIAYGYKVNGRTRGTYDTEGEARRKAKEAQDRGDKVELYSYDTKGDGKETKLRMDADCADSATIDSLIDAATQLFERADSFEVGKK